MGMMFWLLEWLALVFVMVLGVALAVAIVLYVIDKMQTADAVRRNYPVIGRFRSLFTVARRVLPAILLRDGPRGDAVQPRAARLDLPRRRGARQHGGLRLDPVDQRSGHDDLHECRLPAAGPAICQDRTVVDRALGAREPFLAPSFFNISGMSYGAISRPAVRALSHGAKKAGIWMNTGEGGLSPFHLEGGCDIVFQIGTAKYGVRGRDGSLSDEKLAEVAAHPQVKMFEIKLSQGAKPGKGGILPGGEGFAKRSPRSAASPWARPVRARTGTRRWTTGAICST